MNIVSDGSRVFLAFSVPHILQKRYMAFLIGIQ